MTMVRDFTEESCRFKEELKSQGYSLVSAEENGAVEIWTRESQEGDALVSEKIVISYDEKNASFELRVDNNGVSFTSYSGFSENMFQGLSNLQKRKNSICLRQIGGGLENGSC